MRSALAPLSGHRPLLHPWQRGRTSMSPTSLLVMSRLETHTLGRLLTQNTCAANPGATHQLRSKRSGDATAVRGARDQTRCRALRRKRVSNTHGDGIFLDPLALDVVILSIGRHGAGVPTNAVMPFAELVLELERSRLSLRNSHVGHFLAPHPN